jgi:hypothetical protein
MFIFCESPFVLRSSETSFFFLADSDPSVMEFDDEGEAEDGDLKMAIKSFIDSGGLGVSSDEEDGGGNGADGDNGEQAAAERTLTVFVGNLPLDVTQVRHKSSFRNHFLEICKWMSPRGFEPPTSSTLVCLDSAQPAPAS